MDGSRRDLMSSANVQCELEPPNIRHRYRISLEPELFVAFLTLGLSEGIVVILILQKTCEVRLGISKERCDALGSRTSDAEELEAVVQKVAGNILMWKSLLLNVIPALAIFFVGPWSDYNGRKPLIVAGMTGTALMYSFYLILSSIPNLDPAFIVIGVLPLCLLGGYINFYSGAYCYISEICNPDERSFRLGLVEAVVSIGGMIGVLISPHIFEAAKEYGYGFSVIFAISAVISLMALIHAAFFLRESVTLDEEKLNSSRTALSYPVDMIKTCLQPRQNGGRAVILLCTSVLILIVFSYVGILQIELLFLRKRFMWSYDQYTTFTAFSTLTSVIGIFIGTRLLPKYGKVPDMVVAIIGAFLTIFKYLTIALASPDAGYVMYIAVVAGFLGGAYGPALRAILSRTVPPADLGKVFSLTNSFEALSTIAAPPLYTYLYTSSLDNFPGLPFLVNTFIFVVIFILLCAIAAIRRYSAAEVPAEPFIDEITT